MTTKTAAEVFRDYEIDGNPSSGAHKPIKADIRELLGVLETGSIVVPQYVTGSSDTIDDDTTHVIVNRTAPSATALAMPDASLRPGRRLSVIDYSQSVVDHTITLTPFQASQKIMRQSTWPMYSNAASLVSGTFVSVVDPDNASNYVWITVP